VNQRPFGPSRIATSVLRTRIYRCPPAAFSPFTQRGLRFIAPLQAFAFNLRLGAQNGPLTTGPFGTRLDTLRCYFSTRARQPHDEDAPGSVVGDDPIQVLRTASRIGLGEGGCPSRVPACSTAGAR